MCLVHGEREGVSPVPCAFPGVFVRRGTCTDGMLRRAEAGRLPQVGEEKACRTLPPHGIAEPGRDFREGCLPGVRQAEEGKRGKGPVHEHCARPEPGRFSAGAGSCGEAGVFRLVPKSGGGSGGGALTGPCADALHEAYELTG